MGRSVGFICGKYSKSFDRPLANRYACKKHYGLWCRMFFKYYLKQYQMSGPFQIQWDSFLFPITGAGQQDLWDL